MCTKTEKNVLDRGRSAIIIGFYNARVLYVYIYVYTCSETTARNWLVDHTHTGNYRLNSSRITRYHNIQNAKVEVNAMVNRK